MPGHGGDTVAFGWSYIAHPDLVERLATGAPFAGPHGYSDYPTIRHTAA